MKQAAAVSSASFESLRLGEHDFELFYGEGDAWDLRLGHRSVQRATYGEAIHVDIEGGLYLVDG